MNDKLVNPGDKARCRVTKIEGIVTVRHDYLYGVSRVGIQPEGSHEGKEHESVHVDIYQAELIKENVVSRNGMIAESRIKLGDKCVDKISGFNGICTGTAEWLYACTKVCLQTEKLNPKTHQPVDVVWFDEPQLDVAVEKVIKRDKNITGGFGKSICGKPSVSR